MQRSVFYLLGALIAPGVFAQSTINEGSSFSFVPDMEVFREQVAKGTFEELGIPALYVFDAEGRARLSLSGRALDGRLAPKLDAALASTVPTVELTLPDLIPHVLREGSEAGVSREEFGTAGWTFVVITSSALETSSALVQAVERYIVEHPDLDVHVVRAEYDVERTRVRNPDVQTRQSY